MGKKHKKGGRGKKAGDRHPCGKLVQRKEGDAMTKEFLQRRADLVGEDNVRHQSAGVPLGQMRLAGRITERQYRAGQDLERKWRQWAMLVDAPRRDAPAVGGRLPTRLADDSVRRWTDLDAEMTAVLAKMRAVTNGRLAASLVESVVADGVLPPRLLNGWTERGTFWDIGWAAIRDGLDAAADVFKIPRERPVAA